jgi:hypothetical protein
MTAEEVSFDAVGGRRPPLQLNVAPRPGARDCAGYHCNRRPACGGYRVSAKWNFAGIKGRSQMEFGNEGAGDTAVIDRRYN